MKSALTDKRLAIRFAAVSIFGTIADYVLAVLLAVIFGAPSIVAVTFGFVLGTAVNYCGHNIFSYEHTNKESISILGYGKYLMAVAASLAARLAVVVALEFLTQLPFWFILLCAIGVSFVVSYVISTLWVFKKPD